MPARLTVVAVGSRGDVQPYLALSLGLKQAGFQVQFCADHLFEQMVTSVGLPFTPITAAPENLMQQNLSKEGGPLKLLGWLERHLKPLARQLFADLEVAARGTDAILYSSLGFAGYHVAEKLGIPCLPIYNFPATPTRCFYNPSFPPPPAWWPFKKFYNWWSFRSSLQLFFYMVRPVVNECRRDVLGLKPKPWSFYRHFDVSRTPIVYGFSPNLLPRPTDWGEWLQVSGHWFLDTSSGWQPPIDLIHFLDAGAPPVYVGFGSMVDEQIERATRIVLEALQGTGQRGILLGGWGGLGKGNLPDTILHIASAPHDWLFPRVSLVVHHGGAGTTATGLRFGRPTIVVPFFADQPFWGERVFQLGVGPRPIPFKKLTVNSLTDAINRATNDTKYRQNAEILAGKLQAEDGVGKAVSMIQAFLQTGRLTSDPIS